MTYRPVTSVTSMSLSRSWHALALLPALVALTGCAGYEAYRKCGWQGCAGDAQITRAVQLLLKEHPALGPPNQLHVQTSDRVVFLTGQVATDYQREEAESVARAAPDVRQVINTVALEYEGR
jgi:osmotically-inducible protein OsmY